MNSNNKNITQFYNSIVHRDKFDLDLIRGQSDTQKAKRLAIYQTGYRIRLVNSLLEDFSDLKSEISEDRLKKYILEYIQQYPSTTWTIAEVGQTFPDFLAEKSNQLSLLAKIAWAKVKSSATACENHELSVDEITNSLSKSYLKINRTFNYIQHTDHVSGYVHVLTGLEEVHCSNDFFEFLLSLNKQPLQRIEQIIINQKKDEHILIQQIQIWIGQRLLILKKGDPHEIS